MRHMLHQNVADAILFFEQRPAGSVPESIEAFQVRADLRKVGERERLLFDVPSQRLPTMKTGSSSVVPWAATSCKDNRPKGTAAIKSGCARSWSFAYGPGQTVRDDLQ